MTSYPNPSCQSVVLSYIINFLSLFKRGGVWRLPGWVMTSPWRSLPRGCAADWGFPTQSLLRAETNVGVHEVPSIVVIFIQTWSVSKHLSKLPNTKFHSNPFKSCYMQTGGGTDRQTWRSEEHFKTFSCEGV
jgi:hypothetical protein